MTVGGAHSSGPAKVKPLHFALALQYCLASSTSMSQVRLVRRGEVR